MKPLLILIALSFSLITASFSQINGLPAPEWPENPPSEWVSYHLAHPEDINWGPKDPNGAIYHNGKYHLHYIYNGIDDDINIVEQWAHVSSTDMVHWQWHNTTLNNGAIGHDMYSGTAFKTKQDEAAIIYHVGGTNTNFISIAQDANLDTWSTPQAINPSGTPTGFDAWWDPDLFLYNNSYYAISGGGVSFNGETPKIIKSTDLQNWTWIGDFFHPSYDPAALGVQSSEDLSCPNMFQLGNKWMLLGISHNLGCRYYLGDFVNEQFLPDFHGRMNWRTNDWEGLQMTIFAPESMLTPDGRRVMWAWMILDGAPTGIQSLPRELSLPADGILRIKPLTELQSLRTNEVSHQNISVSSGSDYQFTEPSGDAVEFSVTFQAPLPNDFGVRLLTDAGDNNGITITAGANRTDLQISEQDGSEIDVINPEFQLQAGEDLTLRIFIDKKVVEVFANDKQAAAAYTNGYLRSKPNLSLFTNDADVLVSDLKAWNMSSAYSTFPKNGKVMCIGDSRVAGGGEYSYRYDLWKNMLDNGWTADYIGINYDDHNYPTYLGQTFDGDHQSEGGFTTQNVIDHLDFATSGVPDVALLGIGGNDLVGILEGSGLTVNDVISNVNTIIDMLQASNPNVTILVEQIAPARSDFMSTELQNLLDDFNSQIPIVASQQTNATSSVIAVDMYTAWSDSYMADELHYNATGSKVVADKYDAALDAFYSGGNTTTDTLTTNAYKPLVKSGFSEHVRIYPNPTNQGYFTIETTGLAANKSVVIEIFNLQGQKVYSKSTFTEGRMEISSNNDLKAGFYMISIQSANGFVTKRLVIE